jgi:disulfide bond formation protein DsbB
MFASLDRFPLVAFCRRPEIVAGGIFLVALATIVGAWGFQIIGGYIPCELCYQERVPYYLGIPLALVALGSTLYGGPAWLTRGALLLTGLLFAWGTYLAGYHTGVEWHLWPGPTDCSGDTGTLATTGDLLNQISNIRVARCDVVEWTMFGLSFAGWNTVISAGLTLAGLFGAFLTHMRASAAPVAAVRA